MYITRTSDANYEEIIDKIALKDSYFELLGKRYTAVASYIDEHKSELISNIEVYPQGSVKQGTVIKHRENNSFDVDVVIEFESNIYINSQEKIRTEINKLLSGYINANGIKKKLEENKRSYSMVYSDDGFDFHIDFTPVIMYNGIYYLTNKDNPNYHIPSLELEKTNPKALYRWFNEKNIELYETYFQKKFEQLEKSKLTKLQKVIMLTKYSKDLTLKSSLKSIVLTVVMAETFNYQLPYEANFENFKNRLIEEYSKDKVRISNPTEPSENFAEKFNDLNLEEKKEFIESLQEWELVGDEFYAETDYSHAQEINPITDANIQIEGVYHRKGFRAKEFKSGEKVKKGQMNNAMFSIHYDNLSDYNIEWQVTNEGNSARKNHAEVRGRIEYKHSGKEKIKEPISFAGQHWVRCILTHKYSQRTVTSPKFNVNIT